MSDIQNETPETVTVETPIEEVTPVATERKNPRDNNSRPQRNSRRDSMREEDKEFKEELLSIDRVTRVTAGGRQIRFRASIVIGDGKGKIGL